MRIAVFGASGRTGTEVVSRALTAGHGVTAVVRPSSDFADDRVRTVTADITDPSALSPALSGCDAVVTAIGPAPSANPPPSAPTPRAASPPPWRRRGFAGSSRSAPPP
ncbi:NAD(P)H-binding protein [Haloactinospora alba]|uniref:NAD(P)H-binding protein n=1 Tax=Haloactinospora alba TaxID=405555 RepID=UPI001B85EB1F|nr:NAD(P)H-binding protein [Haloactinospora alba]